MSQPPVLEVQDLHVWFDLGQGRELHAVQGTSLTLARGERMGLVGESGCGKTTLSLALMGLLPPNASVAGRVLLDGEDILARGEDSVRPHRWTDIAMVFQGAMNAFNPVQRIGNQIVEAMELHGTAKGGAAQARCGELLELVGIRAERARRFPHEFSGGMRQRAAIAMALACSPKVLLADEPTTALDVMVQAQILQLLMRLSDELGLAIDPHHPRPADRRADLPDGRRHVRRAHRRARADRGAARCAAAPVHAHAVRGHARPRRHDRRGVHPGRAAAARPADSSPARSRRAATRPSRPAGERRPELQAVGAGHVAACHLRGLGRMTRRAAARRARPRRALPAAARARGHAARAREERVVRAVDGISLSVAAGELVALVGESGCGKTTTAQAIMRMLVPRAGSVEIDGRDIAPLSERALRPLRREAQIVFQDPYESLDPRYRVRDTVAEPLVIHRIGTREERVERVREALERAGLSPAELFLDRFPHELSGGQRQRVAIAAALVLEPKLLVADEPVSMLDVSVRAGILDLLDGLRTRRSRHPDDHARPLDRHALRRPRSWSCTSAASSRRGRRARSSASPRHPYTRALISVVPRRDPHDRRRAADPAGRDARTRSTSRPAAASTRAARSATTPAARSIRSSSRPAGHRAACIKL